MKSFIFLFLLISTTAFGSYVGGRTNFVTLPSSSTTDNAVARFDSTTGEIQNSGVIIDDSNNVSGVGTLASGAITSSGSLTVGGNTTSDSNLGTISSVQLSKYYVGTFSVDFLGAYTSTQTKTITYQKVGTIVHLSISSAAANCSNASSITNTGTEIPSGLRPANTVRMFVIVFDNGGSNQAAQIAIDSAGLITIYPGVAGGAFTASSTCGWDRFIEVSYYAG